MSFSVKCECEHSPKWHDMRHTTRCEVPTCACTFFVAKLDDNPIHQFFELSYSSYLILHRSMLQSVSPRLQQKFLDLLDEIKRESKFDENKAPTGYWVRAKNDAGQFVADHYAPYDRGRRDIREEK